MDATFDLAVSRSTAPGVQANIGQAARLRHPETFVRPEASSCCWLKYAGASVADASAGTGVGVAINELVAVVVGAELDVAAVWSSLSPTV